MSITDAPDTYEGNGAGEYTKAIFAVSCVWSGSATATVEYHTYPGTATEGKDYVRARGTLTFMSTNHNPQQIMGKIICDKDREPTETFDVKLSNPQNGSLGASKVGQARILDDDGRVPTRRVD